LSPASEANIVASDLANLYLVYYTQYSSENNDGIHVAQGKQDGGQDKPESAATEFSFHEQGIVNKASAAVQQLRSAVTQELQSHESGLSAKQDELDANRATDLQKLSADQQTEAQLLDQSAGKSSPKYQHLEKQRVSNESSLKKISIDVDGRPLQTYFVSFYLYLLAVLTILEVPINQQAFAFFFEHQPAVAYVIALAVGLFFVFFAHMTGWMIRTTGYTAGQNRPPRPYLVVLGLIAFVLICMYFLASVRATYLTFLTDSTSDASLLSELGLLEVASKAASEWVAVFSSPQALTFLLLNIAIFLVGAFLSFFRHDPHRDYEKVKNEHEKTVENIAQILEDFNKRSIEIIEKYGTKANALNAKLKDKGDEVQAIRDKISALRTNFSNDVEMVRGVVAQEISAYQRGNHSARTEPNPQYFNSATVQAYIANTIKNER
jgi:hypothetical protein